MNPPPLPIFTGISLAATQVTVQSMKINSNTPTWAFTDAQSALTSCVVHMELSVISVIITNGAASAWAFTESHNMRNFDEPHACS